MTNFLIVGNFNSISYKDVFKPIKNNQMWFGASHRGMDFILSDGSTKNVNACWYTNIDHQKRHIPLILTHRFNPDYKRYDNYDAIEVSKSDEIPMDYEGVMGVPISFLDHYNPSQFEIIGTFNNFNPCDYENGFIGGTVTTIPLSNGKTRIWYGPIVDGKPLYKRILIRNKNYGYRNQTTKHQRSSI